MEGLGFGITISLNDLFTGALDNAINKFKGLEGVTEGLVKSVESSFGKLKLGAGIATTGAVLSTPFVLATQKAMDFEQQLSNIKAVAPDTNLSQVSELALQAGKDTVFSATEAAKGIEELVKAGVDMKNIMGGGLTAALNLATAGELGVGEAAEIASIALNTFSKDSLSLEQAADIFAGYSNASATSVRDLKMGLSAVGSVASGMNITLDETANALAVLAQNGLKGSDAGTSLKTMLQNLQPSTKEQIKLFKELGIVSPNNKNLFLTDNGEFQTIDAIAQVLQDTMGNLDTAKRAKYLETMFGTDAVRAANIFFKEGQVGFKKMEENSMKTTAQMVANERLNNLKGSLEQLSGSFDTMMINIGMVLTPILKGIADVGITLVNVFNEIIESPVGPVIVSVGAGIAVATTAIGLGIVAVQGWNIATAIAVPLMKSFAATLGVVNLQLLPIIGVVVAVAGSIYFLKKSYDSFTDVLNGGKKAEGFLGFMQKVGGAIHGVIEVFSTAGKEGFTISENLQNALQDMGLLNFVVAMGTWAVRIKEFFNGFGSGFDRLKQQFTPLLTAFTTLGDAIGNLLSRFGVDFEKNTSTVNLWSSAGKTAFELVMRPITVFTFVLTTLANILGFVIEVGMAFYDNFKGFFTDLGFYFDSFMNGTMTFGQVIEAVFDNIGERVTAMLDKLLNAWTQFKITLIQSVQSLPFGDTLLGMAGVNIVENKNSNNDLESKINKIKQMEDAIKSVQQQAGLGEYNTDYLIQSAINGNFINDKHKEFANTVVPTYVGNQSAIMEDPELRKVFNKQREERSLRDTYQQTVIEKSQRPDVAQPLPPITMQPIFEISLDGEQINNNVKQRQENEGNRK